MVKTPLTYDDRHGVVYDASGERIFETNMLLTSGDDVNDLVKRINMHDELMRTLCDIQQMCIGDIAMGYKLEAETIGPMISAATGLTAPELVERCK